VRLVALLVLASCAGDPAKPPVKPAPVELANQTPTCSEAALGLEQATRGVRAPESSVVVAMRARCGEDRWPVVAIECFAKMREGELGRCARALPDESRGRMFGVLGGGQPDQMAITIARARLEGLEVGVSACNQFVAAVASVLSCDRMPLDARVQLGNETAEFWDLPTHGLPEAAQKRMGDACGASLAELEQQARDAGCML
jgi:hypothetical protein